MLSKESNVKLVYNGGYQCFNCLTNGVMWMSDFDFSDYGMEGSGVIHVCHCANCGADIEYYCADEEKETEDEDIQG